MYQGEHKVWAYIQKSKYTEQGQKNIESMYNKMELMFNKLDKKEVKELYKFCNEDHDEFFDILCALSE